MRAGFDFLILYGEPKFKVGMETAESQGPGTRIQEPEINAKKSIATANFLLYEIQKLNQNPTNMASQRLPGGILEGVPRAPRRSRSCPRALGSILEQNYGEFDFF